MNGVCVLPSLSKWEHAAPIRPGSFELVLPTAGDIRILKKPSWWTVPRIAGLLAIVTAVLAAAIIWVVMLRHRVRSQTRLIETKIQREATLEERTRIARELHDTLMQGVAGIAFQLEAVATHLDATAQEARKQLQLALVMVRHSLADARRSVMNLRAQALETKDLAGALKEGAELLVRNWGYSFISQRKASRVASERPRRVICCEWGRKRWPTRSNIRWRIASKCSCNLTKRACACALRISGKASTRTRCSKMGKPILVCEGCVSERDR